MGVHWAGWEAFRASHRSRVALHGHPTRRHCLRHNTERSVDVPSGAVPSVLGAPDMVITRHEPGSVINCTPTPGFKDS